MNNKRLMQKSILCSAAAALILWLVIYVLPCFGRIIDGPLVINQTASVPLGIYMKIPGKIRSGDYVLFEPEDWVKELKRQNGWVNPEEEDLPFIKKAVTAGHRYTIDNHTASFIVDGRYIGQIFRDDNKGHEMPKQRQGTYIVPDGMFLPVGEASHSFDGRYTGPVSMERIIHRLVPVLTWPGLK